MAAENPLISWLAAQQLILGTASSVLLEPLSPTEMVAALDSRQRNWRRFREIFSQYDFVLCPTVDFTAPDVEYWAGLWKEQGGNPRHMLALDLAARSMMSNVLRLPSISVPVGFVNRLPVAIQIMGKPGSEVGLLQAAQIIVGDGHSLHPSVASG